MKYLIKLVFINKYPPSVAFDQGSGGHKDGVNIVSIKRTGTLLSLTKRGSTG